MKKRLFMSVMACALLYAGNASAQNQLVLSESWQGTGGLQNTFNRNVAKTDPFGNAYVVSSTINNSGNYDIFVQKFDSNGDLLWDYSYDGAASQDDIAADVVLTSAGDYLYVVGTSVEAFLQGADVVLIKLDDSGVQQWVETYDNGQTAPNNHDVGTCLALDVSEQLIAVGGGSFGSGTEMDMLALVYDDAGTLSWADHYDNTNGHDAVVRIVPDGTDFTIAGLSQIATDEWEVVAILYSFAGVQQNVANLPGATADVHEVYDLSVDDIGNFYVAAAFKDLGEGANMTTLKFNSDLTLQWTATYNRANFDDRAYSIRADAAGNVYVAGVSKGTNNDLTLIKYDDTGVQEWIRTFDGGGDDEGTALALSGSNIFVTGRTHNGNDYDFVTLVYTMDGDLLAQSNYAGSGGFDDIATAISVDPNGNPVVAGQEGTSPTAKMARSIKYDAYLWDMESINDVNSKPVAAKNHIIIKFDLAALDPDFVNNTSRRASEIEEVLSGEIIGAMSEALGLDIALDRNVRLIKVFPNITEADVQSISRSGYPVAIPDFQSWVIMTLPEGVIATDAVDALVDASIGGLQWVELDAAFSLAGAANDVEYADQSSLHPTITYPDAHIGMEDAWDRSTGQSWLKVGVVDNSIWWAHQDFGSGTSSSYQNTVIKGGYNFEQNTALPNLAASASLYGHGTSTSATIGAIRDNSLGIAGIAGGDSPTQGASLYDMRVCCATGSNATSSYVSKLSNAIIEGAKSGSQPFNGLHIMNLSLVTGPPNTVGGQMYLLRNAMRFAHANGVVCIAARSEGNSTGQNMQVYPSCVKDDWVLSVGGSTTTGDYGTYQISSGQNRFSLIENVDVMAPADYLNIVSLDDNASGIVSSGGTSMSTAHATGLASLMMSYYNTNSPNYENLWPEDIENVMKYAADDIDGGVAGPGEDDYTGAGKINATQTLDILEQPYYQVLHFTYWSDGSGKVLEETVDELHIEEFEYGYGSNGPSIQEDVEMYSISGTIDHGDLISPSGTILGFWKAESFTDTWDEYVQQGGFKIVDPFKFHFFTSWSSTSATMKGFFYKVTTGPTSGQYIPHDPAQYYRMSYSVHVYDPTGESSIKEQEAQNGLHLYPNPAIETANLSFYINGPQEVAVTVVDMNGKVLEKLPILHCGSGWQSLTLNTERYSTGIYFVSVQSSQMSKTVKLVKQ